MKSASAVAAAAVDTIVMTIRIDAQWAVAAVAAACTGDASVAFASTKLT
jgi:hypothetical protein